MSLTDGQSFDISHVDDEVLWIHKRLCYSRVDCNLSKMDVEKIVSAFEFVEVFITYLLTVV